MPRREAWVGLVEAGQIAGLGFTPLYRLRREGRVRTRRGANGRLQWRVLDLRRERAERASTTAAPAAATANE